MTRSIVDASSPQGLRPGGEATPTTSYYGLNDIEFGGVSYKRSGADLIWPSPCALRPDPSTLNIITSAEYLTPET